MAEIIINVSPKGEATVEAVNFQGPSCTDATRPYVQALGIKDGELPKPEMYEQQNQQQEHRQ